MRGLIVVFYIALSITAIATIVFARGLKNVVLAKNTKINNVSVGKGPDALFLTPDEKFLYVANVEDTFISVIDTKQDKVTKQIDGVDYPWGFTRLGNTNLVAVSGWDKGIDIIDFTKQEVVKSERYEHNLGGISSTKDGKYIFVVATEVNKAFKIDANALNIVDEYKTGNGPDGIGISPDDKKIYITNTKDGTISIIKLDDKTSKLINTGGKPELIHSNRDRSRLYISNFDKNLVHIIDTGKDAIIKEITGLDGPEEAVLSKSEKVLYIVNFNTSKIFTYDADKYEKLDKEYVVGKKPIGIVSAINDTKLYVSNYGDNSISIIKLN